MFFNPSGNSVLIAPQVDDIITAEKIIGDVYGHLTAFVPWAPKHQVVQFWKLAMGTYIERLKLVEEDKNKGIDEESNKDGTIVWLRTNGSEFAWLHVRLDSRPKYYDYRPYIMQEGR